MSTEQTLFDRIGHFTVIPNSVIELWPIIGLDAMGIFIYLRYRSDKHDQSFPTIRLMEAEMGINRRRIVQAIKVLVSHGLLERKRRFCASTIYTLKLPIISHVETMEEPPIVSHVETPLFQGVHTNQTQLTRLNNTRAQEKHKPKEPPKISEPSPISDPVKPKPKTQSPSALDGSMFAENIRPLACEFCNRFGRGPLNNAEYTFWSKKFRELFKQGITPELVAQAFAKMSRDGLTIKSPASIQAIAYDLKRKANGQDFDPEKFEQINWGGVMVTVPKNRV